MTPTNSLARRRGTGVPARTKRFLKQGTTRNAAGRSRQRHRSESPINPTLIIILGVIIIFGLIMLSSASSVLAYQNFGDSYYYVKHQIGYGLLLGGIAFYVMSKIDYHYWRRYAFSIAVGTLVLLLLVFIPGVGVELLGAKRWINIGGFFFQPSEVVKLSFLIYLAAWLEKRGKELHDVHFGFLSFGIMLGVLVLLIAVAQKDLGTTVVIAVISLVTYFVGGAPLKHIAGIIGAGIVAFFGLVAIAPYRAARLTVFLNPDADPQGIGYHISQALLAIGSGGFFGVGLGHSLQKFNYLPEVTTDSIFAIIAEEMGFLFAGAVILLFLLFVFQAIKIAKGAQDQFGKLLAVGIATWIGFQAFVNIGAMLSVLPLTGIPLPFISYGSSSMITLLAATGLLANISRQAKV